MRRLRPGFKLPLPVGILGMVLLMGLLACGGEEASRPAATESSRAGANLTGSTPTYIWIPKYADPRMADKMINSYPATVVTLCTGIFGGAWSPNDPGYWETFDICAVNAQLGFPDPTGVATKGCVSSTSECKKYQLKRP